jgi:hypothetical protein
MSTTSRTLDTQELELRVKDMYREVLLPVALRLLGAKAWWIPNWLNRILPEVKLGHGGLREEPALEGGTA